MLTLFKIEQGGGQNYPPPPPIPQHEIISEGIKFYISNFSAKKIIIGPSPSQCQSSLKQGRANF